MEDPDELSKATIPIAYAQLLLEIVVERGISAEQLLRESQLPIALLTFAEGGISPRQWSPFVWAAIQLTGDEGLGYEYGLRLRPTAHGVLGFALMSCATVGQAIEIALGFFSMRSHDYHLKIRKDGDITIIEIIETHPVVAATVDQALKLRRFFYEGILLGIVHAGRFLTGDRLSGLELWLDWPEPAYHGLYYDRLPPIHFNQSSNQIRVPTANMQLPLVLADPMANQQALIQCNQEKIKHSNTVNELVARVKAELISTQGIGYPSLDTIAVRLHMSERTLKRHLHNANTTYIELLDIVRQQETERLLATTEFDIKHISSLLGYLEPANFCRAFKKWTGETPSQFRKRIRP